MEDNNTNAKQPESSHSIKRYAAESGNAKKNNNRTYQELLLHQMGRNRSLAFVGIAIVGLAVLAFAGVLFSINQQCLGKSSCQEGWVILIILYPFLAILSVGALMSIINASLYFVRKRKLNKYAYKVHNNGDHINGLEHTNKAPSSFLQALGFFIGAVGIIIIFLLIYFGGIANPGGLVPILIGLVLILTAILLVRKNSNK